MNCASISPTPDPLGRLVRELAWQEPQDAFRRLADAPNLVWLDSAGPVGPRSRHSYLCVDPFGILDYRAGTLRLDGAVLRQDPFEALAGLLACWREPGPTGPVPFMGGAAGLLGYGLAHHLERLPRRHAENPNLPELCIGLFDLLLAFDRQARRCWLISTGLPERDTPARAMRARQRAASLIRHLRCPPASVAALPPLTWSPELSPSAYGAMVTRGLDYIRAGDVFQANLTMRHAAPRPPSLDPVAAYLALRDASPAPFAAYIGWSGGALLSASPERFIRLDPDGRIETRPIKGTRPRAADPQQDALEAERLSASLKDRAENLMIVDLMRNDLSRVAVTGSVRVPTLCQVESFAAVHHLVSSVTARLRPDLDAVAVLRATFPGGSVTGAPKIRAMQIIDELEAAARGPYCGCVVWLGFDGAMDSSIVIRTLLVTPGQLIAQAGGGIVADSVVEAEHAEMLVKIAPLLAIFPTPAPALGQDA